MADIIAAENKPMLEVPENRLKYSPWLIRIPETFVAYEADIHAAIRARSIKKLGRDFHLVRLGDPPALRHSEAAKFLSWNLPVQHSWPCCPKETPGFIEKAAQAIYQKFGACTPQTILTGPLDPGSAHRYYRTLASNLRGRMLQIFPPAAGMIRNAEDQDSQTPTLFCLLGKEGLFCGLQCPQDCGGFYPGGTKFIRQNQAGSISRAGAKAAEALHHLQLFRPPPPMGAHWLELGASPGGMTAELLVRNYRVTAVDRAPLDARLRDATGLTPVLGDAATFRPQPGTVFDALLCDMNGDARESLNQVARLTRHLKPGGLVIFTLKTLGAATFDALNELEKSIVASAAAASLNIIACTHLTYNRHEFTLLFEYSPAISNVEKNL